MDPRLLTTDQWMSINSHLRLLVVFVGLMVNTAISFLLAHGIIPSLIASGDMPLEMNAFRRILYPISAISAVLTILAFITAVTGLIGVIQNFYPRFAI